MSGGYGWHQNSVHTNVSDHTYDDAKREYEPKSPTITVKKIGGNTSTPTISNTWPKRNAHEVLQKSLPKQVKNFPEAKHSLKSTASNVIIVVQDVTQSMSTWPLEIWNRLPTLFIEACQYLDSEDLEILFIVHGDARTDNFPIQVSQFAKGKELDNILLSFYMKCGGGGQGSESHELVAYYLTKQVDISSAQNVYTFFVTDESACDTVDPSHIKENLGLVPDQQLLQTKDIFELLKTRTKVFTILCETKNSYYDPQQIRNNWESYVGKEGLISLNDSRRVVDVMLGAIAKLTGQFAQFTQNLTTRQQGTQHEKENVRMVQKSLSLIGSVTPTAPIGLVKKPLI